MEVICILSEPAFNKAFSRNEALNRHKLAHTGEKPYICSDPGCVKAFCIKADLNVHKRLHPGQRPHQCCECGKTFSLKIYLKGHMLAHMKNQHHHHQVKPQEMVDSEEKFGGNGKLIESEEVPDMKLEMETSFQFV